MTRELLLERVRHHLGPLISRRGFAVEYHGPSPMGEEVVRLDSEEFWVLISRDRGGHEWIAVGSKVRPKPRAPLRSYLLGRLIAYQHASDPPIPGDLESQARWLVDHEGEVLHSALINSEDLRLWDVDAARVMFGQKPRGRWPRSASGQPKLDTPEL